MRRPKLLRASLSALRLAPLSGCGRGAGGYGVRLVFRVEAHLAVCLPSLVEKDPVASAVYGFHRSPPRPSPFGGVLEVPTTGQRVLRKQDRANPPDLDAGFPVTSRVSTVRRTTAELPLLGLSKDRPSIVLNRRVRCPVSALPHSPSEVGCRPPRVPSSWFRTTSTGSPLRPRRFVAPCCRSWGSPRFSSPCGECPRGAVLPFEAFPPPTATNQVSLLVRGRDVTVGPSLILPTPPCLAFSPFLSVWWEDGFPSYRTGSPLRHSEPGPQGLAPSSGPLRL